MTAAITELQLENASSDADSLNHFVNDGASPGTYVTRTGRTGYTLARMQSDALAAEATVAAAAAQVFWSGGPVAAWALAPTGSEINGARALVKPSATGAWAGHDNQGAFKQSGAWVFYSASIGQRVYTDDVLVELQWDGTLWTKADREFAALFARKSSPSLQIFYDNFDRPDGALAGTLVQTQNAVYFDAAGDASTVVSGGSFVSNVNTYMSLNTGGDIEYIFGTFTMDSTITSGNPLTLHAQQAGAAAFDYTLHFNFGPTQAQLTVRQNITGADGTDVIPRLSFTYNQLLLDGVTEYMVAMAINKTAGTVRCWAPDGQTGVYTAASITSIAPQRGRIQINTGGLNSHARWTSWGINKSLAKRISAQGGAAPMTELRRTNLYTLGDIPKNSHNLVDNTATAIAQILVASGAGSATFRFHVHTDIGDVIPGYASEDTDWEIVISGNGGVSVYACALYGARRPYTSGGGTAALACTLTLTTVGQVVTVKANSAKSVGTFLGPHPTYYSATQLGDPNHILTLL